MAGNNLTVFQFNFILNNLQFDLIFLFSSLAVAPDSDGRCRRDGVEDCFGGGGGRNGEWHH